MEGLFQYLGAILKMPLIWESSLQSRGCVCISGTLVDPVLSQCKVAGQVVGSIVHRQSAKGLHSHCGARNSGPTFKHPTSAKEGQGGNNTRQSHRGA